jgi:hypothetical protein
MPARFLNKAFQVWPSEEPIDGQALDCLAENLYFETSDGELITVPAGFKSDGGSIPWWGRVVINPTHNQRAWWVHDWAWENNRKDHDKLLREALKVDNCPRLKRHLILLAVQFAWWLYK